MASNTPYRRSSRLASATPAPARSGAGSAAGSVNQSVAGSRATPSRNTSRRLGPLPKVKVTQSHAYGSAGQIAQAADLGLPSAGFDQAFESHRESAIQRDDSTDSSSSSSPSRPSPAMSRASGFRGQSPIQEEIIVVSEQTSLLDSSKSFGAVHEAGLHSNATNGRAMNGNVPATIRDPTPEYQPSPLRVLLRMIQRNWFEFLKALLALLFSCLVLYGAYVASNSASTVELGENLKTGTSNTWHYIKNGLPSSISVPSFSIPSNLNSRVAKLEKASSSHHNSIKDLKKHLPDWIVVRVDDATGKRVISDSFWRALRSKFSQEGLTLTPIADKEAEWKEFLRNNEIKIDNAIGNDRQKLLQHFDNTFQMARQLHQVLTRDEFIKLMQKDYLDMSARVEAEVQKVAKELGTNAILKQIRLESLAYANLLANSELSLRTVNFFSPGLGARVDPRLTSPTQTKEVSMKAKLLNTFLWSPPRQPPVTALERWEEASDCWCTAASNTHQAQLAVKMAHPIFPTRLTIENIPKEGTLNWQSAPKDMELWVEISDNHKRQDVEISWNELGKRPCRDAAPGPNYICIGTMRYDIHGHNHVQTFDLEVDLQSHHVSVKNTVVRVMETWGSPWTCLYRVRMHGNIDEKNAE